MAQTLYASFADAALAEKAAGALLDYGVRKEDISLVANDVSGNTRTTDGAAYSDYDRAVDTTTGQVASTNWARNEAEINGEAIPSSYAGTATLDNPRGFDEVDADDRTVDAHNHTEMAAKSGLSTTTPGDAGAGAAKGAGIGLGVGVLAGLASMMVPGIGLIIGGGALATAIGAAAATTAAGAVAGGVTGYLKDQGVPDEAVNRYHGAIENGGAMLAVTVPSGEVDQTTAGEVLAKYGGADLNAY